MKILHVNEYLSGGGAELYLSKFIEESSKYGIKNILLYGEGIEYEIPKDAIRSYYLKNIAKANCQNYKFKIDKIKKMLKIENPDLIYFHQVYNYYLIEALATERPSIRYIHDFKLICSAGKKTFNSSGKFCEYPCGYSCQMRSYYYRCMPRNPKIGISLIYNAKRISKILKKNTKLIVSSEFMKKALIQNKFVSNNVNVIPYFTSIPKLERVAIKKTEPIILFVGRIVEEKGIQYIIRILPKINGKAKILVVGDGPYLDQLKKITNRLNLSNRVNFTGWLQHSKLDLIYRKCALLVVPSIWPEPFGIVGIEAMSYKKPIIAFNVGGISEWCKNNEVGFLVEKEDEEELAAKINILIENKELSEEMGENGRNLVKERFVPSVHFDRFFQVLKN